MYKTMKSGFSLIELLVVVAIIGILAAVGTVGYQNYIDGTKSRVAQTNAETIAKAITTADLANSAGIDSDCAPTGGVAMTVTACAQEIINNGAFKNPYASGDDKSYAPVEATSYANGCTAYGEISANKADGVIVCLEGDIATIDISSASTLN